MTDNTKLYKRANILERKLENAIDRMEAARDRGDAKAENYWADVVANHGGKFKDICDLLERG